MSPKISAKVHSISWDRSNNVLYVGITQVFAIWAVPFYKAEVSLVTVLHLEQRQESQSDTKWYISSQNDLYQMDQLVKFAAPLLAWTLPILQIFATFACVLMSYIFAPISWWEETQQLHFRREEQPPVWDEAK